MRQTFAGTAVAVVVVDQCSKAIATIALTAAALPNEQALAGILPLHGSTLNIVAAVVLVVGFWLGRGLVAHGLVPPVALGLMLGGGAANLLDRLLYGHVRDFIRIPYLVVNVADFAIGLGVFVFTVSYLRRRARAGDHASGPVSGRTG